MELILKNNQCILTSKSDDFSARSFLSNYITGVEWVRVSEPVAYKKFVSKMVKSPVKLYTEKFDNKSKLSNFTFPRGLYDILEDRIKKLIPTVDITNYKYSVSYDYSKDYKYLSEILQPESGFNLRKDQVFAVYKILGAKRGIVQLGTGVGKTEIMSACIKILTKTYPDIRVLVIEPTDILVQGTVSRFKKYKIDTVQYKESRGGIYNNVVVSHPKALLNDLSNNDKLLEDINVVFWDEAQHLRSDSWSSLNAAVPNAEYVIGLSALVINEDHQHERDIKKLSIDEALIIGATGRLLMYVPMRYYIDNHILATPVIMQVNHQAIEVQRTENNWHILRKKVIESDKRTLLTARVSDMFIRYKRRTLILVETKHQAYYIANVLAYKYGHISNIAISFGSGQGLHIDRSKFEVGESKVKEVNEKSNTKGILGSYLDNINSTISIPENMFINCLEETNNIIEDFDNKKYDVIIGTSHLDEGVDVKDLDVVILASGGKKDRRVIQRVGRGLRRSKTGKYAYIIDFNDEKNGVLGRHSFLRMKLFEEVIETPKDLIYKNIDIERVEPVFKKLEEVEG